MSSYQRVVIEESPAVREARAERLRATQATALQHRLDALHAAVVQSQQSFTSLGAFAQAALGTLAVPASLGAISSDPALDRARSTVEAAEAAHAAASTRCQIEAQRRTRELGQRQHTLAGATAVGVSATTRRSTPSRLRDEAPAATVSLERPSTAGAGSAPQAPTSAGTAVARSAELDDDAREAALRHLEEILARASAPIDLDQVASLTANVLQATRIVEIEASFAAARRAVDLARDGLERQRRDAALATRLLSRCLGLSSPAARSFELELVAVLDGRASLAEDASDRLQRLVEQETMAAITRIAAGMGFDVGGDGDGDGDGDGLMVRNHLTGRSATLLEVDGSTLCTSTAASDDANPVEADHHACADTDLLVAALGAEGLVVRERAVLPPGTLPPKPSPRRPTSRRNPATTSHPLKEQAS